MLGARLFSLACVVPGEVPDGCACSNPTGQCLAGSSCAEDVCRRNCVIGTRCADGQMCGRIGTNEWLYDGIEYGVCPVSGTPVCP